MAHYRVSDRAERDIKNLLAISEKRWGERARQSYAALVVAAMRSAAASPEGRATRFEEHLGHGVRSLHLRDVRVAVDAPVKRPVHRLYFRVAASDLIEIVRILHERMDPARHLKGRRSSA